MRARYPDETGFVERDGVRVAWDRYGDGDPTILLLPTWSIIHSRHWKGQIPYLARHFRVLTFDGRGNGRSDRPPRPAAYSDAEFAEDALAVLDVTGTEVAVIAGLSLGAGYALRLAAVRPDRVIGAIFLGSTLPILDGPVAADDDHASFEEPRPTDESWDRYNAHYWRRNWRQFADWFAGELVFSERHSTKQIEDMVGWMLETDPETIIATERATYLEPPEEWGPTPPGQGRAVAFARRVRCRSLVIHGTDDRISPIGVGERLAAELGASLVTVIGGGHSPLGREPVLVNRLMRDFIQSIADGRR